MEIGYTQFNDADVQPIVEEVKSAIDLQMENGKSREEAKRIEIKYAIATLRNVLETDL